MMDIFGDIESVVMGELDKLKEKIEAFAKIKELEAEIESLKAHLEGDTTPADAIKSAGVKVSAMINQAKPTLSVPQSGSPALG